MSNFKRCSTKRNFIVIQKKKNRGEKRGEKKEKSKKRISMAAADEPPESLSGSGAFHQGLIEVKRR